MKITSSLKNPFKNMCIFLPMSQNIFNRQLKKKFHWYIKNEISPHIFVVRQFPLLVVLPDPTISVIES